MLNEAEEDRLDLLISIIKKEDWHDLKTDTFLWLAEKLKEINQELVNLQGNYDEIKKELVVANIYSSTVAKELTDLRVKHQRANEQATAYAHKNKELKDRIDRIKAKWDDDLSELVEAQLKIEQLEGKA